MSSDVERLVEQVIRTRDELTAALADPDLASDRGRYASVNKRWSDLSGAFDLAGRWQDAAGRASEARELLADDDDPDLRALLSEAEDESRIWGRASARP